MRKRMALAVLFLLSPGLAWAQSGPESILPAKSQLYFRWDGAKAHREEFGKTAFGKTMKGDTGKFLDELWTYATENVEQVLDQNQPQAAGIFRDVKKALTGVVQSGVVLGVEVDKINPPKVNAVLVFPGAAGETGTFLPLIQKAAEAARVEIKDVKVGRRFVHRLEVDGAPGLFVGWWNEGEDAVVTVGTVDPAEYAKLVDAKKTGLGKNPLYKKVQGFNDFTTGSRGFLNVAGIVAAVEDVSPEASRFVDALGVKGLKSITFVAGYDGPAFRNVVEVDMPGKRSGLLSLASTKKFSIKDLPVMPSDATSFSASSMEVGKAYDVIYQIVESGFRIFAPDQADKIPEGLKAVEAMLSVNLRDDLFACFDDMAVSYSSPAEGPLGLGATTLIKVKDGKKLARTIETIVKNIPNQPGFELSLKKKKYRDADIMDLHVKSDFFSIRLGSIAVYKGWFIYSQYPQGVKGFVLRSSGELPVWKADADLTKVLKDFPEAYTAIQVSDPRPTIEAVLSVAPFVVDLLNNLTKFVPNLRPFDIDLIPHAQEATRGLFPRVTITTDDGKRIRSESRSSIGLP
jgi:hypothetical protein